MNNPPNPQTAVDARYYQNTGRMTIARRISNIARRRVHDLFMQKMQPKSGDRILDIGVSDDTGIGSNMLEQLYPYRENLTCASLTGSKLILSAYPGVHHVQIKAGSPLPFDSNEFDIIYSNAVLEHAGSRMQQGRFIAEMCRVGPRRFIAVPNRGFPIEHHTCLPLIHWLPKSWFRALLRGTRYDFWSHEENLNCLSAPDIRAMWPGDGHPTFVYAGIGIGPWKSNLVAYQTST
ncbi:MAG TPA: class I SAM-dependent methyltransferase [Verrucomicrobiae bacterium]